MNVRKVIGMVLLSFSIVASVSASYTDALKQKYADGSFYIEYQVTRQDAKGEIAKNQKPRMWSASQYYFYIFSKGGFTEGLLQAAQRGEVTLVTLADLYN